MLDRKIIIDCDPGTDDALALFLASAYLRERVICLFSTYGNTVLSHTHANLTGLASLLGLGDIPVVKGASAPMGKDGFHPTDYHGENGLCGIVLPPTSVKESGEGADAVYELIRDHGKAVYVALGPLTNLAELLTRHPDAVEYLDEVVIMGGGFVLGNTDCGAEYNFSLDPHAVSVVLSSPVKKTLVPLDLTHTLEFSEGDLAETVGLSRRELCEDSASVRHVLGRIFYANLDTALKNGHVGAIVHDAAAVACLCGGIAYSAEVKKVASDGFGRLFADEAGADLRVVTEMSKNGLTALMKRAFLLLK